MIRVICSKCGTPANLPDHAAGKIAQCKCGQKNPIPRSAGSARPAVPHLSRPQPAKPPAAAPSDDLALQELDQNTGARIENAPVPCPACEKPLPPGEIVCRYCGYVAQEGVMGKDRRIAAKPRAVSWATKPASELTAVDFIKVAASPQLFSTMVLLILRSILAILLMCAVAIGLAFAAPLYLGLLANAPHFISILATWGLGVLLASLIYGIVIKEAFALCQATCFGYESPRTADWPTTRSGFIFLLMLWLPGLVGGLVAAANPIAGSILFAVTAVLIVPITFLSVAQAGGEWTGLSPLRICQWVPKLLLPYMGIVGLIFVELAVISGFSMIGLLSVGVARATTAGAPDWAVIGMSVGVIVVSALLSLHPLVYMAAMLGMLYRKYERRLLG